jgi:serine/threonine protein kinase
VHFWHTRSLDKRLIHDYGKQFYEMMYNERRMLNLFDHPFIVRLMFDFETKNYLFLVMELVSGGSIYAEMKKRHQIPEAQVRSVISCFSTS